MLGSTALQSMVLLDGTHTYQLLKTDDIDSLNGNLGIGFGLISFELMLAGNTFTKMSGRIEVPGMKVETLIFSEKGVFLTATYDSAVAGVANKMSIRLEQVNAQYSGLVVTDFGTTTKTYEMKVGIMFPNEALSFHGDGATIDVAPTDIALLSMDQSFAGSNNFEKPIGIPTKDGTPPKYGYVAYFDGTGVVLRSPSTELPYQGVGHLFFSLEYISADDILLADGSDFDPLEYPELALKYPSHQLIDMVGSTIRGVGVGEVPKMKIGSDSILIKASDLPPHKLSIPTAKDIGATEVSAGAVIIRKQSIENVEYSMNDGIQTNLKNIPTSILGYWYIIAKPTTNYYNNSTYKTGQTIHGTKQVFSDTEFPCVLLDGAEMTSEIAHAYPKYVELNGGTKLKDAMLFTDDFYHGEHVPTAEHILGEAFDRVFKVQVLIDAVAGTANTVVLNKSEYHASIVRATVNTNNGTSLLSHSIFLDDTDRLMMSYSVDPANPVVSIFVDVSVLLSRKELIAEKYVKSYSYGVLTDFGALATPPISRSRSGGGGDLDVKAPLTLKPSVTNTYSFQNIGGNIYTITANITVTENVAEISADGIMGTVDGTFSCIGVSTVGVVSMPEIFIVTFSNKTKKCTVRRGSGEVLLKDSSYSFSASFVI